MGTDETTAIGRREARKQDRRDAIVEVAKRWFLEKGYDATSMSAIAAEIGGSKATLWSYFSSKEALFEAVLDMATTLHRQAMMNSLDPDANLAKGALDFARAFIQKLTRAEPLQLHRLVIAESARNPEVARMFFDRGPGPTIDLLARFFASAIARGQMRDADPRRAAQVFVNLCLGNLHRLVMWNLAEATPEAIEAEAQEVVDVFMRAFGSGAQR